jgi:hypothetical protein
MFVEIEKLFGIITISDRGINTHLSIEWNLFLIGLGEQ